MEIIGTEIEAAARMKSLASETGERREFDYMERRGIYHVGQSRYIEAVYGMVPLARYRNPSAVRAQPKRAAL